MKTKFKNTKKKKIDEKLMVKPLEVILANICMNKMENDIVGPRSPLFYNATETPEQAGVMKHQKSKNIP